MGILQKCLLFGALFVLSLIASSALSSTDTKAQSVYDNVMHVIQPPYETGNTTKTRDQLIEFLKNRNFDSCQGQANQVISAIENNDRPYLITAFNYQSYPNTDGFDFYVDISDNPINETQWSSSSALMTGMDIQLHVDFDGNNIYHACNLNPGTVTISQTERSFQWFRYVESNVQLTYPEGYDGVRPTPVAPPLPPSTAKPDIYMSSMVSFKGEFSDRNFFTFDGIPFTCGEFVPQINVEVWTTHGEPNEVLLDSLSTTASSQFTYTFPTSPQTNDYRIVSWYSCPEISFSEVSFYDFQINSSGGLVDAIPCNAELFCSLNLPTYGLTQALLSPLAFVSQLPTTQCEALTLPMPHGMSNISLPCMTPIYQQYFGTILVVYQTVLTGLFAYYVSLRLFGNVKQLTNPRDDQVETVKL